jgi:CTP:molybdopterin cytidylyltransferase MocA
MKPSLLILAAGMGSRYGSLKQVDRFGPSGETIVEYSIYDALRAGFSKIIMVVRKEFVNDFKDLILRNAMNKNLTTYLKDYPYQLTGQNHGEPVMPCL